MMCSLSFWLPLLLIYWVNEFPVTAPHPAYAIPPLAPWIPVKPDSPPSPTPAPTPAPAGRPKRVRCLSLLFPTCYNQWYSCPQDCSKNCFMDCVSCKPICRCNLPGALCQDPRFVGGDGITFYFHGRKDQNFCLVSDNNLHINGHFIGKRNPKLTRDYTWVRSIGILFDDHKLLVGAKKTSKWNENEEHLFISFDNTPLRSVEGKNWNIYRNSSLLITRTAPANGVAIEVENSFRITATVVPIGAEESRVHGYNITDDDCFAHLELGFKFFNLSDEVDGVLGQTYRRNYVSKIKISAIMPVMGDIPKYYSSAIFGTDCIVSRFGRRIPVTDFGEGM
ncbi:Root cap [Cynara cardunculus var. scolymus]|uniref:Root cap n=2 Tax=Cynara cardunculus var. scolymus TaxID=59895 RepID=A0A103Y9P4_CYNCS|nr:Root cap [Cynara cardunculus var. scolymus]